MCRHVSLKAARVSNAKQCAPFVHGHKNFAKKNEHRDRTIHLTYCVIGISQHACISCTFMSFSCNFLCTFDILLDTKFSSSSV